MMTTKNSLPLVALLLCSCSFVQHQQQQLQTGYEFCSEEAKHISKSMEDFKADVMKSVAARLHITTGNEKEEDSVILLSDEELSVLKKIVKTLQDAPPVTRSSWRIGSNVASIARAGYSAFKSIRFLDNEGRELASLALNHGSDEAHPDEAKHDAHSRSLTAEKQKEIDALPTVSCYNK